MQTRTILAAAFIVAAVLVITKTFSTPHQCQPQSSNIVESRKTVMKKTECIKKTKTPPPPPVNLSAIIIICNHNDRVALPITELSLKSSSSSFAIQIVTIDLTDSPGANDFLLREGRRRVLSSARGEWVVFPRPGDYYTPRWMESFANASSGNESNAIFWNAADGSQGYVSPIHVAANGETSSQISDFQARSLVDGSFAVRLNSLQGAYPTDEEIEREAGRGYGNAEAVAMLRRAAPESIEEGRAPRIADPVRDAYLFWSNADHVQSREKGHLTDGSFLTVVMTTKGFDLDPLKLLLYSLRQQTYSSFDLLLINTGPDDSPRNSLDEIFRNSPRTSYYRVERNESNAYQPLQFGLEAAQNAYVLFANEGDYYAPTFVETMRIFTLKSSNTNLMHTSMVDFEKSRDAATERVREGWTWRPTVVDFREIVLGTSVIRTEIAKKIGFSFLANKKNAEWLFLRRVLTVDFRVVVPVAQERLLFLRGIATM